MKAEHLKQLKKCRRIAGRHIKEKALNPKLLNYFSGYYNALNYAIHLESLK